MKVIKGYGAPTVETIGEVNDFYVDLDTGDVYRCTCIKTIGEEWGGVTLYARTLDNTLYTWEAAGINTDGLVTDEDIIKALGYTPADDADVTQLKSDFNKLETDVTNTKDALDEIGDLRSDLLEYSDDGESSNKFDMSKVTRNRWIYADGRSEEYANSFTIGEITIPSNHTLIFSFYLISNGTKYYGRMRGGCVYDSNKNTVVTDIPLADNTCGYYNPRNHEIYVTVNIASTFIGHVDNGERKLSFDIVEGDVTEQLISNEENTIVPDYVDFNSIPSMVVKKSILPKELFIDDLPTYHEEEVDRTIETLLQRTKTPSLVYSVVADMHTDGNDEAVNNAIKSMAYVNKQAYIDSIVALGDFNVSDVTMTQEESDENINRIRSQFLEINPNVYMVQGNHDGKNGSVSDKFNNFNTMHTHNKKVIRPYGKSYFYVNHEELKVRCYFLNTVERKALDANEYTIWGLWTEQLNWFKESLASLDNEWDFMIFTHVGTFSDNFPIGEESQTRKNNAEFIGIINTYNAHENEYSEKLGHCILVMCGHEHFDWIVPFEYSKITSPTVSITRLGLGNSNPSNSDWDVTLPTKKEGTNTECAWDIMAYNKDDKKIYFIRYGAGEDRVVDLNDYFN